MIQHISVGLRILFGLANLFQSHVLSDSSLLNIGKCRTSEGSQSKTEPLFQRPEDPIQFLAKYLAELPTEATSGSDQDNGEKNDKDAA